MSGLGAPPALQATHPSTLSPPADETVSAQGHRAAMSPTLESDTSDSDKEVSLSDTSAETSTSWAEPHNTSVDTENVVFRKCLTCGKLQASLHEERSRAEAAEARISMLEAERTQMIAKLELERVRNQQAEADIETLETELRQRQMDLCNVLEAALQSASDSSAAADDLVKAQMAELAEKELQNATLTTQLDEHRDKFAQQEARLKEQINEMQDRFGDQELHLQALEEEVGVLTDSLSRMTEKVRTGLHARWPELAGTELSQLATSHVLNAVHSQDESVQNQSAFGETLTSKIVDLEPQLLAFEALIEKFEEEVCFRLRTQLANMHSMEATWEEQLSLAQNDVQAVRSKLQRLEDWIQVDQESTAAERSRVKDEHSQEIEDLRLRHQEEVAQMKDEHSQGVEDSRLRHQEEVARMKVEHGQSIEDSRLRHQEEVARMKDEHGQGIEDLRRRHQEEVARMKDEHSQEVEDLRRRHQAELARIAKEAEPVLLSKPQVAEMIRLQAEHDGYPSVDAELIDSLFAEFDSDKSGSMDNKEWESLARVLRLRLELERIAKEAQPVLLSKPQVAEMIRLQAEHDGYPSVDAELIDSLFAEFDSDKSGSMDNKEWERLARVLTLRLHHAEVARINDEHSQEVEDLRRRHQAELARIAKEAEPVLLSKPEVAEMIRSQAERDGYPSVDAELIDSLFAEFDSDKSGFFDAEVRALERMLALRLNHQAELERITEEHKKTIAAIPQFGES